MVAHGPRRRLVAAMHGLLSISIYVAVYAGAPRSLSVDCAADWRPGAAKRKRSLCSRRLLAHVCTSGCRGLRMWRRQSGQAGCRSQDHRIGPRSGLSTASLVLALGTGPGTGSSSALTPMACLSNRRLSNTFQLHGTVFFVSITTPTPPFVPGIGEIADVHGRDVERDDVFSDSHLCELAWEF
jgi:hypothetical protein